MGGLIEVWRGFGPETKAAIIGAAGTFFAALVAFGSLIWQLSSQARQSREAIAENERRKLKAEMYENAVSVSRYLADAAIDLSTYLRSMMMQVRAASSAFTLNIGFPTPNARFPILAAKYDAFSEAALRFIFLVEHRRFIDPRLVVFRTALSVVLHETREIMFSRLVPLTVPGLPVEGPAGLLPYTPPSLEDAEAIEALSERFIRELDDSVSYTEDFLVELQNRLLGDLFGNEVPHREPIDPASKVVTLDRAEELENWFATSTAWGQNNARVESEVRERLGQSAPTGHMEASPDPEEKA